MRLQPLQRHRERPGRVGASGSDQHKLISGLDGPRDVRSGGVGDRDSVAGDHSVDELPGVRRLVRWGVGRDHLQAAILS